MTFTGSNVDAFESLVAAEGQEVPALGLRRSGGSHEAWEHSGLTGQMLVWSLCDSFKEVAGDATRLSSMGEHVR